MIIKKYCSSIGYQDSSFFYQEILRKNKTPKYLNAPKKDNKAYKLGVIYPHKIADKKKNQ